LVGSRLEAPSTSKESRISVYLFIRMSFCTKGTDDLADSRESEGGYHDSFRARWLARQVVG
jgi:hypothetical protein